MALVEYLTKLMDKNQINLMAKDEYELSSNSEKNRVEQKEREKLIEGLSEEELTSSLEITERALNLLLRFQNGDWCFSVDFNNNFC